MLLNFCKLYYVDVQVIDTSMTSHKYSIIIFLKIVIYLIVTIAWVSKLTAVALRSHIRTTSLSSGVAVNVFVHTYMIIDW